MSVGATTTERVQETPMVECKSSSVSMMHANVASGKRGKINRFQRIKARAFGDAGSGMTVTYLLDTGAEYSFVREDAASALGVVGRAQPVKVEGALTSGGADRAESLLSNSGIEDPDERVGALAILGSDPR
ncbi:hypothetical protein D917_03785 [Trichinella nativa]|uniref:Peptidase A2 domain-containing protein n=1 Tax=Trichinella nativa TaxID=6335 RepID=A0A1Y3E6R1_9BILA|nr:hypothetical protein D917_03785 [Trichinella nativa]